MKKGTCFVCFCCILLLLAGCSNGTREADQRKGSVVSPTQAKKKVALIMKTLTNPFFIEMERGARRAEKELGLELTVRTGAKETSIEQQIAIVEELIREKTDAIVIAPGSSTELIPALKKAQDAGISIVNIDNRLDTELSKKAGLINVPFISVDNVRGSFLSAKYVCDKVTTPTKAAIIEGIRVANNAQKRKEGAQKAFKENANIQLVASETANWMIDEASEVAKKIFARHPDIGLLFCANDMMALGALHYLEQAGIKHVLVAGYDALDEAKNAIREGKLAVTVDQQPEVQGYLGVKFAFDMIQGKTPPLEKIIDVILVSKETL